LKYNLSIVIPVYNAHQYLDACILSILREMRDGDELLLINDGSTDDSYEICKKYESDQVLVINNTNHGVSYTRNCGIQRAVNDYVTFVDADDYLQPGWRNTLENGMQTEQDIIFFSSESAYVPSKKEIVSSILFLPNTQPLSVRAGACWSKLFLLSFVRENQLFFDSEIINGEDGLFCLSAVIATDRYTVVQSPEFYYYRVNTSSATHRYNEKFNTSNLKYVATADRLLKEFGGFSDEECQYYVDLIQARGLYILAYKISLIKDSSLRRKQHTLFEQQEYLALYERHIPGKTCSYMERTTFALLKRRRFKWALIRIALLRSIYQTVKKMIR